MLTALVPQGLQLAAVCCYLKIRHTEGESKCRGRDLKLAQDYCSFGCAKHLSDFPSAFGPRQMSVQTWTTKGILMFVFIYLFIYLFFAFKVYGYDLWLTGMSLPAVLFISNKNKLIVLFRFCKAKYFNVYLQTFISIVSCPILLQVCLR